ncbi:MAG: thiamine pyrophosphate-binding protein, partial [Promethearchaeota archaeon]
MTQEELLKEKIRAGTGIARMLKDNGVQKVFGIPDGHTLALYDGLLQTEGIDHILLNDERTAAFAADAYARVSGNLGVCDAGAAGSMNFPVALAEAKGFGSPVLALVGVVKVKHKLRNVPHDIDVAGVLKPITKSTQEVFIPEQLPRFLKFAIRNAKNGKNGPTALIIPEDVMQSQDLALGEYIKTGGGACATEGCRIAPAASEVEQAVRMIREAKQPVIFSGSQAVTSGAFGEIKKLSEMLNAPVFSTIGGKGIMSQAEENLYFGTVGLFGEKPNHKFLRKSADLMIIVGNRMTEDDTANFKIPSHKLKKIQIDIEPREIGLTFDAQEIVGDCQIALSMMIEGLKEMGISDSEDVEVVLKERLGRIDKLKTDHLKYRERDSKNWLTKQPIKPQRVLKSIADVMGPNDYLVTDASSSSRWIGPYYPVKGIGRKIITARGVGPTGFGLGALIGTSIALDELYSKEEKPHVVLITGDGGLMNAGLSD